MAGFTGALDMLGDMGNLDPEGMAAFNNIFQNNLRLPAETLKDFQDSVGELASTTMLYIFLTIFVIALLIIWALVILGTFNWVFGLVLSLIALVVIIVIALMYQKSMQRQSSKVLNKLSSHVGAYTEDFAGKLITTFTQASEEYSKITRQKKAALADAAKQEEMKQRKAQLLKKKARS